jgi:hypothetical protein
MGWCSGTIVFDAMMDAVLADNPPSKEETVRLLVSALEDMDWDCQSDSEYYGHPVVEKVMRELHHDWFED